MYLKYDFSLKLMKKQWKKKTKYEKKTYLRKDVVEEALQRISMNFTLYYNYYHWGYVDEAHTYTQTLTLTLNT